MKITRDQLNTYKKYAGDIDWIYRLNDEEAKTLFDNNDSWRTINLIVEDIHLIDRKLVSEEYKNRALTEIENNVDKVDVDFLYTIARGLQVKN
jgi:hypothetical protein